MINSDSMGILLPFRDSVGEIAFETVCGCEIQLTCDLNMYSEKKKRKELTSVDGSNAYE